MAVKVMPQQLFDYGTAVLAYHHSRLGDPLARMAAGLWAEYARHYPGDSCESDWTVAAQRVAEVACALFPDGSAIGVLELCRDWAKNHEIDGKRRRWRMFDGTLFNKAAPNPSRIDDCVKRLGGFLILAKAGTVPREWLD